LNANPNTLNGNSLNVVFTDIKQQLIFSGANLPQSGVYTAGIRIKKNSGDCVIQISHNSIYYSYDLSKIANGDEVILSTHANFKEFTQGAMARFSIIHPLLLLIRGLILIF
jgi:hypothetical protein